MTGRQDAVLNELKFKVERLIKLYIASLETKRIQESRINELLAEIESLKSENKILNKELNSQSGKRNFR